MSEDPTPNGRRNIVLTRIVEALVIAAITAGATGYVSLRVVEARAESDREAISELKGALRDTVRAVNQLTATMSAVEARTEERQRSMDARLRALEDRRR